MTPVPVSDKVGPVHTAVGWCADPSRLLDRLLDAAPHPLTIDKLAHTLGIPPTFVAYMVSERVRKGRLAGTHDGGFVRTPKKRRPADRGLAALLECVRQCEADWELDRRLGLG